MERMAAGTLVQHRTLGTGKVVAVEATALHVFFPASDSRFAAKLRWPTAGPFLSQDGLAPDPWLQGLTSFAMDPTSGRYALAANFISQDEAVAIYLSENPGAFEAPEALRRGAQRHDRRSVWRSASAEWAKLLGDGQASKLVEEAEYEELGRRALLVAARGAPVPGMPEIADLEEAFEPGEEIRNYLEALVSHISAPSPVRARFERLCAASHALGVPADAAWPMVTFLPFVAVPSRHIVLVPRSASSGASRLGCDLALQAAPSWASYGRLRELAGRLLERLTPKGGRDMVDVECFLHATGARRPPPRRARAAVATPAPKAGAATSRRKR